MKLIHITDTHFVAPGIKLYGLDPRARLDAAIADIKRNHADAELAVVTGDLTHWGEVDAYLNFTRMHAGLAAYLTLSWSATTIGAAACLGRSLAAAAARRTASCRAGATCRAAGCCFSTRWTRRATPASCASAGSLGAYALQERRATGRSISSCIIRRSRSACTRWTALHLAERAAFADIVKAHQDRIRHLFFGHVHRPISGNWMGIPFSTLAQH